MSFVVVWEAKGASVRYAGPTDDTEVARAAQCIKSNERFSDLRYVVHDFSACAIGPVTPLVVQELSANYYGASGATVDVPIVVIANSDKQAREWANAGANYPWSAVPARLFSSGEAAYRWLADSHLFKGPVPRLG